MQSIICWVVTGRLAHSWMSQMLGFCIHMRMHFRSREGDQDRNVSGDKTKKMSSQSLMNQCTGAGAAPAVDLHPDCSKIHRRVRLGANRDAITVRS